jgi:hypothetical protein
MSGKEEKDSVVIDLTQEQDALLTCPIVEKHLKNNVNKSQCPKKFSIYCDLDGVLVDFNEGVKRLNRGKGADELPRQQLWGSIARADHFFLTLPWTKDGKDLWSAIIQNGYYPSILTGIPFVKGSREEKFLWCERELKYAFDDSGQEVIFNHVDYASPRNSHQRKSGSMKKGNHIVNVITCWSSNKHFESGTQRVLIDDREDIGLKWSAKGGIFIHHVTAAATIAAMVQRGILEGSADEDGKEKREEFGTASERKRKGSNTSTKVEKKRLKG